jgi:NAD(P)-dependent dehydrogenase (short-subunit alcohol dehydrogenase family)
MKGKTVVITGATSGIGEIAAERLAQMGARIVLIARDKSRGRGDPGAASRLGARPWPRGPLRRFGAHSRDEARGRRNRPSR